MNDTKRPHPEDSPNLRKADYICNSVFQLAKINLSLYLFEGASLQETARLAEHLKTCIDAAYDFAVQDAKHVAQASDNPTEFDQDLDPNNPFG